MSSPSLPSAFAFVFKWLGLLTHTLFWAIQLNFISVYYASLLLEAVTISPCFQKEYWITWTSTRVQTSRMGFFFWPSWTLGLTSSRLQRGKLIGPPPPACDIPELLGQFSNAGQGYCLHLRMVLYLQGPEATGNSMLNLLYLKECASVWEWHLSLPVFKTQFESWISGEFL